MNNLWISERMISDGFWGALNRSVYFKEAYDDARLVAEITAPLVDKFPSIAGSISIEDAKLIWLLTKYFSPKCVGEVGAYIGRSTAMMCCGGSSSLHILYTCDGTFDCMDFGVFEDSALSKEKKNSIRKIKYFGKTMSTEMLQAGKDEGDKFDMIFIDGRLADKDIGILRESISKECVFLIDDFEGVEKGTVNALMIKNAFPNYILLEPYRETQSVLAVMVPSQILKLSRQQSLPVNM